MNITPEQMIAVIQKISRSGMGLAPVKKIIAAFPGEESRHILGLLSDMEEMDRSIETRWFAYGITLRDEDFERAYMVRR